MIRIKADRCGYDKYKCVGIPQISEDSNGMFDENVAIVASMKAEFNKLPMRIKGMVFSEDTTNMSWPDGGPHPEVPELTCRTNTDPLSDDTDVSVHPVCLDVVISGHTYQYPVYGGTSGWADLFNAEYQHGEDPQYFYRNTVVGSTNAVASDVFIITGDTHWHNIYSLGGLSSGHNGVPNFTVDITDTMENSIEMGPGLLEPMLDTDFDPVDISTIPAWEAGDDAFTLNNILINGWKGVVDDRFRNVYARLNSIHPGGVDQDLLDLINQDNSVNECPSFMITLVNGEALQKKNSITENTYSVSYSSIIVNGVSIDIIPLSGLTFYLEPTDTVMYVWLVIDEEEEPISGAPYTVSVIADSEDPSEAENAPENRHVYLIGGVIRIDGDPGDYVLFKIFQEECISEVNFGGGESGDIGVIVTGQDGETIIPIEGSTDTPSPGIVQRSANIWYEPNYEQSSQDVPTVEAVYNFIHGIAAYGGGVANALATPEIVDSDGSTLYGEATAGGVIQAYRDRSQQNSEAQISGWTNAQIRYGTAYANWEDAGEPDDGPIYDEYIEAQAEYNTYHDIIYGTVDPGVPGTTLIVDGIAISSDSIMGSGNAVPTATAVYLFVHSNYALAEHGTVTVDQGVHSASHGTPGTVFTVDILDIDAYTNGTYYEDQVPTVKAVMDYVKLEGATAATPAMLSGGTYTEVEGYTYYNAGIVQNVVNVLVTGGVYDNAKEAVPTVEAVYNFIHNLDDDTISQALATIGYMGSTVSVPATTAGVDGATATKPEERGTVIEDAIPGTALIVHNIDVRGETADSGVVPTALAVAEYIKTCTALPGMLELSGDGGETWIDDLDSTAGIVQVSANIVCGPTPSIAFFAVPSVEAVYEFVSDLVKGATAGYIEAGSEGGEEITGETYCPGFVQTSLNIFVNPEYPVSSEAVPTVKAVYDFVHNLDDDTIAQALATIGGMTVATGSTSASLYDCIPGTCIVVGNMVEGEDKEDIGCVPTTQAVIDYIRNLDYSPVSGELGDDGDWVSGGTVKAGMVEVSINVKPASTEGVAAYTAVPTVQAVVDYVGALIPDEAVGFGLDDSGNFIEIEGATPEAGTVYLATNVKAGDEYSDASYAVPTVNAVASFVSGYLAVSGELDESTGNWVSGSTNSPGIVDVATNVVLGATDSSAASAVPTVRAVAEYVLLHGVTAAVSGDLENGDFINGNTVTYGIVRVARNVMNGDPTKDAYYAVPTVDAVATYVQQHTGVIGATAGVIRTDGEGWTTASIAGIVDVASNIIGATTSITTSAVPTVLAVAEYVDSHVPDEAVSEDLGPGGNFPTTGSTASPGIVYVASTLVSGDTDSDAEYAVPTVNAVSHYVAGLVIGSTAGILAADGETWTTASVAGYVDVSANVVLGTTSNYAGSAVPTVHAVAEYVQEHIIGSTVGELASDGESWMTASIAGYVDVSANVVLGTTANYAGSAVPTVHAVAEYVREHIVGSTAGELASDGSSWVTASIAGYVDVSTVVVLGSTDNYAGSAVPTVHAVAEYVQEHIVGSTAGVLAVDGTWSTASIAGIVDVSNTVVGATTSATQSAVPTVFAVAEYVATHGGGYTGAFAGTKNENGTVNIGPGHAYFGGTSWSFAGASNLSLANGATKFAECARGTSTITLRDTPTTDLTKATFPLVGKDSSGNLIQCQYGDINIVGRWM